MKSIELVVGLVYLLFAKRLVVADETARSAKV